MRYKLLLAVYDGDLPTDDEGPLVCFAELKSSEDPQEMYNALEELRKEINQ